MANNDLLVIKNTGGIIEAADPNELRKALIGAFVGRSDPSGAVTPKQRLGTPPVPWGDVYACRLFLEGVELTPDSSTQLPNQISDGRVRSTQSCLPDFLRANGATNQFTLLAATTNLSIVINNTAVTYNVDIIETGLTLAPSANNTADIDDTSLTGAEYTKYQGEDGTTITIDNAGSEITDRIGQCASFSHGSSEIFFGYIKSATEITNVFRGYYLDSTGTPRQREVMNNNDTITLLETGWIFLEDDGAQIDVSYLTPIVDYIEPPSPALGQYWLDLSTGEWKRNGGAGFVVINRLPVGLVVIDTANAIATRSFDFTLAYNELNTITLEKESNEIVKSKEITNRISVYNSLVAVDYSFMQWDITTDLEPSFTEAASTLYFIYITKEGESILSPIKPYDRPELKGQYHPYNSWRCIGSIFNNGTSDFETPYALAFKDENIKFISATGSFVVPLGVELFDVELWGGGGSGGRQGSGSGGGGAGGYSQSNVNNLLPSQAVPVVIGSGGAALSSPTASNGKPGGSTSFGSFLSATGGQGGRKATAPDYGAGGTGGAGSGGDINIKGSDGFNGTAIVGQPITFGGSGGSAPRGGGGGRGGQRGVADPLNTGLAGSIPGGGGGGASILAVGASSGAGADGLVVVKWKAK